MKPKIEPLEWYAYIHENGTLHVRRFFGDYGDIEEAEESPFLKEVCGPFEAMTREEALAIAQIKMV
jgi:hypothetical protein